MTSSGRSPSSRGPGQVRYTFGQTPQQLLAGDAGTVIPAAVDTVKDGDLRRPACQGLRAEWVICVLIRIPDSACLRPVLVAAGLVAEGEDCCLDAVLQAKFGEDAADVGLDGLLADGQVPADLPVAVTAGD
jgi:hypothetical protein